MFRSCHFFCEKQKVIEKRVPRCVYVHHIVEHKSGHNQCESVSARSPCLVTRANFASEEIMEILAVRIQIFLSVGAK